MTPTNKLAEEIKSSSEAKKRGRPKIHKSKLNRLRKKIRAGMDFGLSRWEIAEKLGLNYNSLNYAICRWGWSPFQKKK